MHDLELMQHKKNRAKEVAIEKGEKVKEEEKKVKEEKKTTKIAAQDKFGKGKNEKARKAFKLMKLNIHANDEMKTKEADRAKR